MKIEYKPSSMAFNVSESFNESVKAPETATVLQLKEFDEYCETLVVNPMGIISEAFERIFNEPFDDGTEEYPNELEGQV